MSNDLIKRIEEALKPSKGDATIRVTFNSDLSKYDAQGIASEHFTRTRGWVPKDVVQVASDCYDINLTCVNRRDPDRSLERLSASLEDDGRVKSVSQGQVTSEDSLIEKFVKAHPAFMVGETLYVHSSLWNHAICRDPMSNKRGDDYTKMNIRDWFPKMTYGYSKLANRKNIKDVTSQMIRDWAMPRAEVVSKYTGELKSLEHYAAAFERLADGLDEFRAN